MPQCRELIYIKCKVVNLRAQAKPIHIILQKEEKKDTGPACPLNQPITGVPTFKPTNGIFGGGDGGVANC